MEQVKHLFPYKFCEIYYRLPRLWSSRNGMFLISVCCICRLHGNNWMLIFTAHQISDTEIEWTARKRCFQWEVNISNIFSHLNNNINCVKYLCNLHVTYKWPDAFFFAFNYRDRDRDSLLFTGEAPYSPSLKPVNWIPLSNPVQLTWIVFSIAIIAILVFV